MDKAGNRSIGSGHIDSEKRHFLRDRMRVVICLLLTLQLPAHLGLGGDTELHPDLLLRSLNVPLPVAQTPTVLGACTPRKDSFLVSRRPVGRHLGSLGVLRSS